MLVTRLKFWVYLGVRTCELFLCFVAIVRVRVSFTGSYTEVEPKFSGGKI